MEPAPPYHATRADLLRRMGLSQESRAAYDEALTLAGNRAEIAYLSRGGTSSSSEPGASFRAQGSPSS